MNVQLTEERHDKDDQLNDRQRIESLDQVRALCLTSLYREGLSRCHAGHVGRVLGGAVE